jgi:hypothetical protein
MDMPWRSFKSLSLALINWRASQLLRPRAFLFQAVRLMPATPPKRDRYQIIGSRAYIRPFAANAAIGKNIGKIKHIVR